MKKQISIVFHLIDKSQIRCLKKEWKETKEAHVVTKITKDSTGVNEEKTYIPRSSVVKIMVYESNYD